MSALGNPGFSTPTPVPAPSTTPGAAAPPPSRSWGWYLAGAAVIAGAAGWMLLQNRQEKNQNAEGQGSVKTAKVTVGPLVQTVRVAGLTASRAFVSVVAPVMRGPEAGREMSLLFLIRSGSRVKKGDLVAQIDAKTIEDHVDDIGDDIEQAESDIRRRKAEQAVDLENLNQTIRAAKAEAEKAQLDAKAAEVRTDVERELLQLTVEETAARYKQVQADTQQKLAGYAAELRILGITRDRHIRHRNRHRIDLVKFKIFAPMDGLAVIQSMFRGGEMSLIQQGDSVTAGQLFMKVVDPSRMIIEGNINQTESNGFRLGQKAEIRLDAYPAMQLAGQVDAIGALATRGWRENFFIRNLPVRVLITGNDPRLIPDLSASADVVTGRVENAKMVPLGAIQNVGGKEMVFVRTAQGRFDKRAVELGERNNTHVAVKSGVEPGEEVALEQPAAAPQATSASL